ncbi:MAG: hypothetical protein IJ829_07480, partial [Kiritimatiellae bacterium]|nr:hypothetical protein [Kiritimatiellia bacterium]
GALRVENTRRNIERIDAHLKGIGDALVRRAGVEARFVLASRAALEEAGWFDLARPDAETLWRRLRARKDVKVVAAPYAETMPGNEACVRGVTEVYYPTDFEVRMSVRGPAAEEPQSFTMREVGTRLLATPTLTADNIRFDLEIETFVVGEPTWQEYGATVPTPDGERPVTLSMRQPTFPVHSCDTKLTLAPGALAVCGGEDVPADGETFSLVFISACLIDAKTTARDDRGAGVVVVRSSAAHANGMETRGYETCVNALVRISDADECVPHPFGEGEDDDQWRCEIMNVFADIGVAWPDGSTAFMSESTGELKVTNTPENLKAFESALRRFELGGEEDIEVSARFVEASRAALEEVGWFDFGRKDAAALYRRLVRTPGAKVVSSPSVTTREGEEAVGKNVRELIYPTDFDVLTGPLVYGPGTNDWRTIDVGVAAVEPQSFTMREVGTILNATPTSCRGMIDLQGVSVQRVGEPAWNDFGVMLPWPKDPKEYALPQKQPAFPVQDLSLELSLVDGETVVFGGATDGTAKGADTFTLIFLTARRLTTGGQAITRRTTNDE